jgi:hypothetical protein
MTGKDITDSENPDSSVFSVTSFQRKVTEASFFERHLEFVDPVRNLLFKIKAALFKGM